MKILCFHVLESIQDIDKDERKKIMKKMIKRSAAAVFAVCMLMTGCGGKGNNNVVDTSVTTTANDLLAEAESISIYTGREVENEEDLAIFKLSAVPPEGYETVVDSAEGKLYVSPNGSITVKAQNFKEEFDTLEVFADRGCAAIKVSNMTYQADTEFSEPENTTVAGFDAIKRDYFVTAYIFLYETDANGEQVKDQDGNPILTDEKNVYGEYVNRVYFFYSDEDAFYIVCESPKKTAEAAAKEFDEFIASVKIS